MSTDKTGKLISRGDIVSFIYRCAKYYGRVIAIDLATGELHLEMIDIFIVNPKDCAIQNFIKDIDKTPGQL